MNIEIVKPWEHPEWDAYTGTHPGANIYHWAAWCRIVCDVGRYEPLFLMARREGALAGLLPAVVIRSRFTGDRMCALSFSDECCALADDAESARALLDEANRIRIEHGLSFVEMRGAPSLRDGNDGSTIAVEAGFREHDHFDTFRLPLEPDTDAVFARLHKKSVRPTIKLASRLGVTVRRGEGSGDIAAFYRMYCGTRKRHGVPPQPVKLFERILHSGGGPPSATLYLAEHGDRPISAIIVMRSGGTTFLKYEVADDRYRHMRPVHALLWRSIQDACTKGDRVYDFGRTERDNEGLASFKSRWGAERIALPYYFSPKVEGVSVARRDSLKHRLLAGTFRRLPLGFSQWLGAKIFRHFG